MYKRLTLEQRYTISVLLQRKCSKKSIAESIGVHPSTITRELRRNSSQRGVYKWEWVQKNLQLDIFPVSMMQLGNHATKNYSDPQAWHNQLYSLVITKIDEEIFKPLFPEGKKNGCPNVSIRLLVDMSILKESLKRI